MALCEDQNSYGGIEMAHFCVEYMMDSIASETKRTYVGANSKAEAYDIATYETIPSTEGRHPYAAWVHSVTYNNGNYRVFNTFAGKPY